MTCFSGVIFLSTTVMTCHKVYTQACTRFRQFHPTELASNESKNIYFIYLLKFMTINGYANSKSFSLWDAFGPNSIKEITELFSVSIDFRGVGGAYRNLSSNWNESNDNGIEHSNQIFNFWNNLFQLLIKEKWIETNNTYLLLVDIIPPYPREGGYFFWKKFFVNIIPLPPYRLTKKYI